MCINVYIHIESNEISIFSEEMGREDVYLPFQTCSHSRLIQLLLGEGNGNPLQYSCLENAMDKRAW